MASRKEAKEAARQRRIEAEAAAKAAADRRRRLGLFGGMVVLVVVVVGVVIAVASGGGGKGIPGNIAKRKAIVKQVNTLLAGIPQNGTTLGSPTAPVTMTYFGDLECPFCAQFSTSSSALPEFISKQVRTGKVKVVYRSFCTATCNDEGQSFFDKQQALAYSAGLQKKFWNYAELFYHEQGAEGSGYVTSTFQNTLASQAGLNLSTWQSGRTNPKVSGQVSTDESSGNAQGISGTPTVIFSGPKGKAQPNASVPDYSQLVSSMQQVA